MIAYENIIANVITDTIYLGAKKRQKGPNVNYGPRYVKDKELWNQFIRDHKADIKEQAREVKDNYGTLARAEWATAIPMFKLYTKKLDVKPFVRGTNTKEIKITKQRILKKFISMNKKLTSVVKGMDKQGFLTGAKLTKETLDSVVDDRGKFVVTTTGKIKVNKKLKEADILKFLGSQGFKKYKLVHTFTKGGVAKIELHNSFKKGEFIYYKKLTFTAKQLEGMLELTKDEIKDKSKIIREFGTHIKKNILKNNDASAGKHLLS